MNTERYDSVYSLVKNKEVIRDRKKCRKLIKMIIHSGELNVPQILPDMVKLMAHTDLLIKKMAGSFLVKHADKLQDVALLGLNTLVKDCEDPNPMIRGFAVKTLSSLNLEASCDFMLKVIITCLDDSSSYVRRAAVLACAKLHDLSPALFMDNNLTDRLYGMIRDPDPIVVVNCLQVIQHILLAEKGIVLNRKIAFYLLNKLTDMTDQGKAVILDILIKFTPKNESEMYDIMNLVDVYLEHSNEAIVFHAFKYFMHLTKDHQSLQTEVVKRASSSFIRFVNSRAQELAFFSLCTIREHAIPLGNEILVANIKAFYCKHSDPDYIKKEKVSILQLISTDECVADVIVELSRMCNEHTSEDLIKDIIDALVKLAKNFTTHFELCIQTLFKMLSSKSKHVVSMSLNELSKIKLTVNKYSDLKSSVSVIPSVFLEVQPNSKSTCCALYLLSEYGEYIEDSPYILEEFVTDNYDNVSKSTEVCHTLLDACVKLFYKRPAECQEMLGVILEKCLEHGDYNLRDRVTFYYSLLQNYSNQASKCIVFDN